MKDPIDTDHTTTRPHHTPGQRVHIDADTRDWGRVVGPATVVENYGNGRVQVDAEAIRATITVGSKEIHEPREY